MSLSRLRGFALLVLFVGLFAGWAVLLRPGSLGGTTAYLVVRGDSMLPTYRTGDLVILRAREAYHAGEIVAYRVPAGELGAGHIVIHRIVAGDASAGFELEGDHNLAPDPWRPHAADVVGAAWVVLPGAGRVLATVRQPVVLASAAAALVVGWFVAGGLRRREDGEEEPEAGDDPRHHVRWMPHPRPGPRSRRLAGGRRGY
jgi:signal peptidase I